MWDFLIIIFVIIFVIVWLIIRTKNPSLLGIGENRNNQKIDKVKLAQCGFCNKGVLDPKFAWWRYFFAIYLPVGYVLITGRPKEYKCTHCNKVTKDVKTKALFTRISLSHHMPIAFVVAQIAIFVVALLIMCFVGFKVLGL